MSVTELPRIIIVDDNPTFRSILGDFIGRKRFATVVAEFSDGHELIKHFTSTPAEAVLMDIQLPGLSGIDTTKYIRRHLSEKIKIIGLSQFHETVYVEHMQNAGAQAYIDKSQVAKHLESAIHEVVQGEQFFPEII